MIVLHCRLLARILLHHRGQSSFRLTTDARQTIRDYRDIQLTAMYPDLMIKNTKYGKPIADNYSQFVFNHSHSQYHYVLAYSQDVQDLGVDLEDFNRQVKMQALAQRSFHPNEYKMWQQLEYCRNFWFKVWTIKEAVLKAHGMGIRLALDSLDTQAHPTWDFGRVEHPLLGVFYYQNVQLAHVMMTVAYRQHEMILQELKLQ